MVGKAAVTWSDARGPLERATAGLDSAAKKAIATWIELLCSWNARIDLTAARSGGELVDLMLADALVLAPRIAQGRAVVDVGCGRGAPGLAIALARPDLAVTLCEPLVKRVSFLRTVVGTVGRADVAIERVRGEELRGTWDVAISRATLAPPAWLALGSAARAGDVGAAREGRAPCAGRRDGRRRRRVRVAGDERRAESDPVRANELERPAPMPITADDLRTARARTAPYVRRTPLLAADPGSFGDADVSFKLELLQHAGSFKARGAFNNLVSRAIPAAGVTAASGGNHGVAVALAARRLGHAATIFVPDIAFNREGRGDPCAGGRGRHRGSALRRCASGVRPACEGERRAARAPVRRRGHDRRSRLARDRVGGRPRALRARAARHGAHRGGRGGLIAGVAAWWRGRVKVVGVEPEGSRCLHAALEAGHPVDVTVESVAADSLGARRVGELAFGIAREAVERVVLVNDDAIRAAQGALWTGYRIAAEPGGATALAALAAGAYQPTKGERVGVLLCGGNVDPGSLAEITAHPAARTSAR